VAGSNWPLASSLAPAPISVSRASRMMPAGSRSPEAVQRYRVAGKRVGGRDGPFAVGSASRRSRRRCGSVPVAAPSAASETAPAIGRPANPEKGRRSATANRNRPSASRFTGSSRPDTVKSTPPPRADSFRQCDCTVLRHNARLQRPGEIAIETGRQRHIGQLGNARHRPIASTSKRVAGAPSGPVVVRLRRASALLGGRGRN